MLSADPQRRVAPYAVVVITNTLRALWTDPRPAQPPVPVWRDGVLVGVLVVWAVVEGLLRAD